MTRFRSRRLPGQSLVLDALTVLAFCSPALGQSQTPLANNGTRDNFVRSSRRVTPERIVFQDAKAAYSQLISHAWGDLNTSFVQLNADGTYRHKVTTHPPPGGCPVGLPNFDHRGEWTMRWKGDHGMVQLETGDMLAIALGKTELFFTDRWMPRTDRTLYITSKSNRAYQDLPKFQDQPIYEKLADTRWRKSHSFDEYRLPTSVILDPLGRFSVDYRGGECSSEGYWSLVEQGTKLLRVHENDACDLRSAGKSETWISGERPVLDDGMIQFFGGDYRPESVKTDQQVFTFDSYSNTVRTTVTIPGPLKKGTPQTCTIRFKAIDGDYVLDQLSIEQSELTLIPKGFTQKGESKPVTVIKLGMDLAQGKTAERRFEFTPICSGACIRTDLLFRYKNHQQDFTSRGGGMGPVKE